MEKKNQPDVIYFEDPEMLPDPKPLTAEQIKMAPRIAGVDRIHKLHPIDEKALEEMLNRLKAEYPKIV